MAERMRLDALLFEKGLFESRERARSAVMMGHVYIGGARAEKPGQQVQRDAPVEVRGADAEFVSRGGYKLKKALTRFDIDLNGAVAADIGASTGGFTDCMLQNGAKKVYSIDVGYGQLAWKLRQDARVVCMERTNIRNVTLEAIGEPCDFCTADVSFISLRLVLPVMNMIIREGGLAVCLVKPQFEAGRGKVGKKGVVSSKETHVEVLRAFMDNAVKARFNVKAIDFSPIRGPEGNIEFLGFLEKASGGGHDEIDAAKTVDDAHAALIKDSGRRDS